MSSWIGRLFAAVVVVGLAAFAGFTFYLDSRLRTELLIKATKRLGTGVEGVLFFPTFDPRDQSTPRIEVALTPVARGLTEPTDLVSLPPPHAAMVVTERQGRLTLVDLETGALARWLDVEVEHTSPEQGLLGVAIHPGFAQNGRLFLNSTVLEEGKQISLVTEYRVPDPARSLEETPSFVQQVMRVEQPFANHNGGCLRFGPDGKLYIGWGDGGGSDQKGNAQDGKTWLGSILRIDVDADDDAGQPGQPYRVPSDNPLRDREDFAPETFAIGVRNPWRFSWDGKGRMIVADQGQDEWEEIGYALPGDNLGWNVVEGYNCFADPDCETGGLREPFLVYPHAPDGAVIGGLVSTARLPVALRGLYVYGNEESGRLWAVKPPEDELDAAPAPALLGAWPIHPSTFGSDHDGRLYVADGLRGVIFRFDEADP